MLIYAGPPGAPLAVTVTHDPIQELFTVSWKSGQNGGYPQTFSVYLRPATGESSPQEENSPEEGILSKSGIEDPGFAKQIEHNIDVKGQEYMEYEFYVASVNQLGNTNSIIVQGQRASEYDEVVVVLVLGGFCGYHWGRNFLNFLHETRILCDILCTEIPSVKRIVKLVQGKLDQVRCKRDFRF